MLIACAVTDGDREKQHRLTDLLGRLRPAQQAEALAERRDRLAPCLGKLGRHVRGNHTRADAVRADTVRSELCGQCLPVNPITANFDAA